MKIFHDVGYPSNINYLDKNGFFVGWGGGGDCCAQGGEFFSREASLDESKEIKDFNPETYSFNPGFLKEIDTVEAGESESGGAVVFELVNDTDQNDKVYLVVYNWHNGYYSSSVHVKQGEQPIFDASL